MVPRDVFNRMAVLALVAIILLCALFVRAFATETDEYDDYLDSGPIAGDIDGEGPPADSSALLSEIAAIHQSLDIILYFVIPCSAAVLMVYLLCKWFCSTFVDSVL